MEPLPLPDFPPRAADSHKGSCGRVLIVAGSARYPGAAILAARGAGRAGAGLVQVAVPQGIAELLVPAAPFAVLHEGQAEAGGGFHAGAAGPVLTEAGRADAVVIGPGLGTADSTAAFVHTLLAGIQAPVVLDADGLNLIAQGSGPQTGADDLPAARILSTRPGPTVLTPHPGEFARLSGGPLPPEPQRQELAGQLARQLGCVVVLKGAGTVVTNGTALRVETAGNPGMATGGMGDVLSGILGALLAVLPTPASAAALAVHLHARAGDLAAQELGLESLLPTDVADRFGRALQAWRAS